MSKPKILIVDDIEANRLSFLKILRDVNAEFFMADNGFDAISLSLEHQFALVLLDVHMPDMDGFDVCEQLRANLDDDQPPIIFVSAALKEDEHRITGYLSGATDYVTKPINPLILQAKVQVFLKIFRQQQQLLDMNRRLQQMVSTDVLTGIANRRSFFDNAENEFDRFKRYHHGFSIIVIDIDLFKKINDNFGHQDGDKVLKEFSAYINEHVRSADTFARIGGEEFAILAPNTYEKEACRMVEKLLAGIKSLEISSDTQDCIIPVSFSAGIAMVTPDDKSIQEIMKRADDALYDAKKAGRGAVYVATAEASVASNCKC